jgi:hypothetical protein
MNSGNGYARKPNAFRLLLEVKLDEWGGLAMDEPESCGSQIPNPLMYPPGLPGNHRFGFKSISTDPEAECERVCMYLVMMANAKAKPTFGLTLATAKIQASCEILLRESPACQREPLRRLSRREIATESPVSFLWLHPGWNLLLDHAVAQGLDLKS